MIDYIKFWVAKELAHVGIFLAVVLAVVGAMLIYAGYLEVSNWLDRKIHKEAK